MRAVADECYRAGARFVEIKYFDLHVKRARILYGGDDSIGYATELVVRAARAAAAEQVGDHQPVGRHRSVGAGRPRPGPARPQTTTRPVNAEWLKAISERSVNWTVGPSPTPVWAAVVHPDLEPDAALEQLW